MIYWLGDFGADRWGKDRRRRLKKTFSGSWLRKDFVKVRQISLLEVVVRWRKKELARRLLSLQLAEGARPGKFYGFYIWVSAPFSRLCKVDQALSKWNQPLLAFAASTAAWGEYVRPKISFGGLISSLCNRTHATVSVSYIWRMFSRWRW